MKSLNTLIKALLIAILIGGTAAYSFSNYRDNQELRDRITNLHVVEQELAATKKDLLGYTKFTDYLSVTKTAMSEQMKFLAAKVDREYFHVEHIEGSKLGLKSEATVILKYAVEYSFGYDLKPDSFSISGTTNSITVTLRKPELVASPAVKIISHEIPSKGILINEQGAVIALQQQLHGIALNQAKYIQKDEAVIALCEKKLGEFLHDFLARQPNVKIVPAIKFAYK